MKVTTDMSALCNAHGGTKTTADLSHVQHAGYTHHLQHAVVVGRSHELVVTLRTPRIGSRRPADYAHKYNVTISSRRTGKKRCVEPENINRPPVQKKFFKDTKIYKFKDILS